MSLSNTSTRQIKMECLKQAVIMIQGYQGGFGKPERSDVAMMLAKRLYAWVTETPKEEDDGA